MAAGYTWGYSVDNPGSRSFQQDVDNGVIGVMHKIKLMCVIAVSVLFVISGSSFAEENEDPGNITQWQDLGNGEYMTESGKIVQAEDLGEGQLVTDSGKYLQEQSPGGDELVTSDEKMVQVDE